MNKPKIIAINFLLLSFFAVIGCGEGDTNNYYDESNTEELSAVSSACDSSSPNSDADADGFSNCDEINIYGTSPLLKDTDGDGISDYAEVINFGFNKTNNNFKFNPLIADVPKIQISFSSAPSIGLDFETSSSVGNSITAGQSEEYRSAVAKSNSSTNSTAYEVSHTRSREFSVSSGLSLEGPSFDLTGTVGYDFSNSTTEETSLSWNKEQTEENAKTLETAQTIETSEGIAVTGGSIAVTVDVLNQGALAFTMKNMSISAVMTTPRGERVLEPVGTLNRQSNTSSFPQFTLGPNQTNQTLIFSSALNVATTKSLLADSSALSLKVVGYELTDENDKAFDLALTDVNAKTATVILDYGNKNGRATERYMVATNSNPESLKVSVRDVLSKTLNLSNSAEASSYTYSVNSDTGVLSSLRGVSTDGSNNAFWIAVHQNSDGVEKVLQTYDPTLEAYDFNDINLKSGDVLHLIYFEDADQDGLGIRQEFAFGTDPINADTDGDGLNDAVEVYVYGSSPNKADTDFDGFNDPQEALAGSDANDFLNTPLDRVLANENASFVISPQGSLWSWGSNSRCLLRDVLPFTECDPDGAFGRSPIPGQVGVKTNWRAIENAGIYGGAVLADDGTLWTWQRPTLNQIGFGRVPGLFTPANRLAKVNNDTNWVSVQERWALKNNGTLWYISRTDVTQVLFDGPDDDLLPDNDWADVRHPLALKKDGSLWVNQAAKKLLDALGGGLTNEDLVSWVEVVPDSKWDRIGAGNECCFAIKDVDENGGGSLWAWGLNDKGQLGLGDTVKRTVPEQIVFDGPDEDTLPDKDWAWVSSTLGTAWAGKTDGTIWAWGFANAGVIGPGLPDGNNLEPIKYEGDWAVIDMAGGFSRHVLAVSMSGDLSGWGRNGQGELGLGYLGDEINPQVIGDFAEFYQVAP